MLSNSLIENGQLYNMFWALNRPSPGNEVAPADRRLLLSCAPPMASIPRCGRDPLS